MAFIFVTSRLQRSRDKNGDLLPELRLNDSLVAWVDTRWPQRFRLTRDVTNTDFEDSGLASTDFYQLYEGGRYKLSLEDAHNFSRIISRKDPVDLRRKYIKPIWTAILLLVALKIVQVLIWKYIGEENLAIPQENRLQSLDIFRGLCITGTICMICT